MMMESLVAWYTTQLSYGKGADYLRFISEEGVILSAQYIVLSVPMVGSSGVHRIRDILKACFDQHCRLSLSSQACLSW